MTDASFVKRRYLALWFLFLPTDRLRIGRAEHPGRPREATYGTPWALVCKVRGALRLGTVNAVAHALGLAPGMTLADARAIQPDLAIADMDEAADRHCLQRLARRCIDWSPRVTIAPPDGITLDITGVDHLFGGEGKLIAQIEETMVLIGMTVRLAAAPTPEAAHALARHARLPIKDEREAIHALPVGALALEAEATQALARAGLKTLGDVALRPSAVIAARFGRGAVTALHRLLGGEQAPLDPLPQPSPLRFERRFSEPVALQASIAACFLELLKEAAHVLEQRGRGGRHFVLTLCRSDGVRQRIAIETGLPTRNPGPVMRLFNERIAAAADPLDPGFGYDSIVLSIPVAEPLATTQPGLDGAEEIERSLAELIDRFSTRLGPDSIVRLTPRDSHIPEQAQRVLPAIQCPAPVSWPAPPAGEPPLRPLFLFDPPQPIEVIAEVPDGPPHRFRWKGALHEVRLYEGPERIATEWWRRKGGEQPGQGGLTRDYYRVEDRDGRRYWVFRHGLYEEKSDPRWYLHGLFA